MMKLYFYMHFPKRQKKMKDDAVARASNACNEFVASQWWRSAEECIFDCLYATFRIIMIVKMFVDVDDNENANDGDDDDIQALLVVFFQLKFIKHIMMLCGGGWTCSCRWCSWCSPPYVALQLITFSLPWASSSSLLLFEVVVSFSFS